MHSRVSLILAAVFFSGLASFAHAQQNEESPTYKVRDLVHELAFDPTKFFPSPYTEDRSVVRIVYSGDDYGWPVYAIALAEGCVDDEDPRLGECSLRLRARMVRAPAPPELVRPRHRGTYLVGGLVNRGATSREQVRASLTELGVEWGEADLRTCPGALAALSRSTGAVWVPERIANPTPEDGVLNLVLHADTVQVESQQYRRVSVYEGWIEEGSPAAWAVDLASTLEPCWRPAELPAPWFREQAVAEEG
jgi:hypothetical protein